jgi:hypothetical protein
MHARTVGFYREGETSMLEQSLAGHGLLFGAMEITQDRPIGILASRHYARQVGECGLDG